MLKRISLLWALAALCCPALSRAQIKLTLTTPVVSTIPATTAQFFGTLTNGGQTTLFLNDLTFSLTGTGLVPDNTKFFDLVTDTLAPGESYTGLLFEVGVDGAAAAGNYTGLVTLLDSVAPDVLGFSTSQSFRVTVASRAVSGKILLESIVDSAVNLQFQFRPTGQGAVFTRSMTLTRDGFFNLTGLPANKYTLHIKGDRWLATNVVVDLTNGDVSGVQAGLNAGDTNNDNACDATDFGFFVGVYNTSAAVPGSGYDYHGDFNNDGSIDASDFGLFVGDYNTVGAP